MKVYLTYATVTILVLSTLSGCSQRTQTQVRAVQPPVFTGAPENPYYLFTESELHRKRGDLDDAADYLRRALELDPGSIFLQRELAGLYIEQMNTDQALAVLENILKTSPLDIETLLVFGRLNLSLDRTEPAKEAFERALSADPKRENLYTALGRIYMAEDDLANATRIFRQMIEYFPASFVGHFYLGRIHAREGRPQDAEREFEKTLVLEPSLLEPRFELIELLKTSGFVGQVLTVGKGETIADLSRQRYNRFDSTVEKAILAVNPDLKNIDDVHAGQRVRFPEPRTLRTGGRSNTANDQIIRLYKEILGENPRSIRAEVELGLFYDEINRTADAEQVLKALGARSRTETAVLTTLVRQFFEQDRYQEVWTALQYMIMGDPDNPDLYYVSGLALSEFGQKENAVENFRRVGPDSRFYENAVINTALIYQEQERLDEAIRLMETAIDQMPDNGELMLFLGTLFEEQQDYERAESVLLQGIETDADNTKLHFRLGVVYDKWGRKDDCIASMETVIRLDPDHANALNYLGYTYADMGKNLDEAEALIQRALELKPDDGYITDSLGWVYYKKGLYPEALELIKKAVELVPTDPIILEHLGDIYRELNQPDEAIKQYRRSLDHRTEDREIIEKKIRDLTQDDKDGS